MSATIDAQTHDTGRFDYEKSPEFLDYLSRRLAIAKDPRNRIPAEKVFADIRRKYGL